MNLNGSKGSPAEDIPSEILKQTSDIHFPIMAQVINLSIDNDCYSNDVKLAEVARFFKKGMT